MFPDRKETNNEIEGPNLGLKNVFDFFYREFSLNFSLGFARRVKGGKVCLLPRFSLSPNFSHILFASRISAGKLGSKILGIIIWKSCR